MPTKNRAFNYLILLATFISFLVSVGLWFFTENNQLEAIFVGIWVPSILCLGILLQVARD